MKNLRIKLSVLALILGLGSAFATIKPQFAIKRWTQDPQSLTYTDITALGDNYECSESTNLCTVEYPEGVNPNDQEHDAYPGTAPASNQVSGDFSN